MAEKRKITCDCGGKLVEKKVTLHTVETQAMVCPTCGFLTLTETQAEKYAKLIQLHSIIDADRKIIKIGNSNSVFIRKN